MSTHKNLDSLITTEELERKLDDPNLRIFDGTVHFASGGTTRSGLSDWQEGRPVSVEPCCYAQTTAKSRPDESWWATQEEAQAAIGDDAVCTLNALPRALFTGETEMGYSRPGRIAGSQNAPFTGVLDPESGSLRSEADLREHFSMVATGSATRVISYCGGGIAATLTGFALRRLGHSNVGVYDGSLNEWSRDPKLPMETGE